VRAAEELAKLDTEISKK
jgi:hypothetical protein